MKLQLSLTHEDGKEDFVDFDFLKVTTNPHPMKCIESGYSLLMANYRASQEESKA